MIRPLVPDNKHLTTDKVFFSLDYLSHLSVMDAIKRSICYMEFV